MSENQISRKDYKDYNWDNLTINKNFILNSSCVFVNNSVSSTFTSQIKILAITNQIILGSGTTTTINAAVPISSNILTIPDARQNCNIISQSINDGLTNTSTRPAITGGTALAGSFEIRSYSSSGLGGDDGFLRLRAGGGTNALSSSYIDLSGSSTVPDMNHNIVFGVSGIEQARVTNSGFNISSATSSSSTTTGALIVTGGTGIGGALWSGGIINGPSVSLSNTTNQIVLGTTNATTINATAPAASRTYNIPDVLGNYNFLLGASLIVILPASGTTTITTAQSGTTFILVQATANTTINLPAVASGLNYKFFVSATSNGFTQTISATAAVIFGYLIGPAGATNITNVSTKTNIILSATAANVKIGDSCEIWSDGINWYVRAITSGLSVGWSFT